MMKEKPILFSTPMVQAILAGRKTMTRRTNGIPKELNVEWSFMGNSKNVDFPIPGDNNQGRTWYLFENNHNNGKNWIITCPYGEVGDRLWVRETWKPKYVKGGLDGFRMQYPNDYPWFYAADGESEEGYGSWKPSIHMPRSASRITLQITNIRVEQLNHISSADAIAEGIEIIRKRDPLPVVFKNYIGDKSQESGYYDPRQSFFSLWESINGFGSVELRPWVFVIEFKRV